jgi:hypothetical protein
LEEALSNTTLAIATLAFVFAARGLRVALYVYFALLVPFFRKKLVSPFLYFLFFFGGEEVGVALLSSEVWVALLSLEGGVVLLSLEDWVVQCSSLSSFESIPSQRRRRPDKASFKIPFMVTMIRSLAAGTSTAADAGGRAHKDIFEAGALKFT